MEQINQTDSQGRKQGYWEEMDINKHLWKGHYKNNKKEGIWRAYSDNKVLLSEVQYINNKKEGLAVEYNHNGKLSRKGHYLRGKEHGLWKGYHETGAFSSIVHYHQGAWQGIWEWYFSDGRLWRRRYYYNDVLEKEDNDETLQIYNKIIKKIGIEYWILIRDKINLLHPIEILGLL